MMRTKNSAISPALYHLLQQHAGRFERETGAGIIINGHS